MSNEDLLRRVEKLELRYSEDHDNIIRNKYELEAVMTKVIKEANSDIINMVKEMDLDNKTKLAELETRIITLENREANIALERWKGIKIASRNWLIVSLLSNLPYFLKEIIKMFK